MRLYSRTGADKLTHEGETYTRGADGAFELPEHVARAVAGFHVGKVPIWETEVEQQQRFIGEDLARRSDPASQYDLLERIAGKAPASDSDARIEALLRRVAELEAAGKASAEPDGDDEGEGDEAAVEPVAKRPRSRKTRPSDG